MDLAEELQKPAYADMTHEQRLAALHGVSVSAIGRIEQGNLKVLEAIIADGLWRDKMVALKESATVVLADPTATAEEKTLATIKLKVVAGFHEAIAESKLANKAPADAGGHSVNMSDPKVQQTFGAAQMPGIELVTPPEVAKVMGLATYDRKPWQSVTLRDVIAVCQPELLDGQWHELSATDGRAFVVRLAAALPEQSHIVIQVQDQYGDGQSDWYHGTALHGLSAAREYSATVPRNGYPRKIRYKCEYALNAAVSVR